MCDLTCNCQRERNNLCNPDDIIRQMSSDITLSIPLVLHHPLQLCTIVQSISKSFCLSIPLVLHHPLQHRNQIMRRRMIWAINPPRAASPFATVALLAAHEEPVQGTRIERRAILCTKQPENEGTSCPPCAQDKAGSDARGTKKRVYAFHQAQKEALPSHGSRAG